MSDSKILMILRAIVRRGDDYLLVKRDTNDTWQADKWEFPGGKVDFGEDLNISLKREVREETGLEIKIEEPLFFWETVPDSPKYQGKISVTLFFECTVPINSKVKMSSEHKEYKWLKFNDIYRHKNLSTGTAEALVRLREEY
jgi:8-oxo-dGTP diphosphatase